jgi:hypothetical protein
MSIILSGRLKPGRKRLVATLYPGAETSTTYQTTYLPDRHLVQEAGSIGLHEDRFRSL